jgi:protein-tyrosine-phosphatase
MDAANLADLKRQQQRLAPTHAELLPMGLFDPERGDSVPDVPDPYYGELDDFREVYAQLERSCAAFLNWVQAKTA